MDRFFVKKSVLSRALMLALVALCAFVLTALNVSIGVTVAVCFFVAFSGYAVIMTAPVRLLAEAEKIFDGECDPTHLLKESEFLLDCLNEKNPNCLLVKIDQAVACIGTGDAERAVAIFKELDVEKKGTNDVVRAIYYNDLSYAYAVLGDLKGAEENYEKAKGIIEGIKNRKQRESFKPLVLWMLAEIEYIRGNYENTLSLCERIPTKNARDNVEKSFLCARAQLSLGKIAAARIMLEHVSAAGNKLWIAEMAKAMISDIDRSCK